ncbi:MAG: hypothetical protein AAF621_05555, partial [Pseudomonadota bacterium]
QKTEILVEEAVNRFIEYLTLNENYELSLKSIEDFMHELPKGSKIYKELSTRLQSVGKCTEEYIEKISEEETPTVIFALKQKLKKLTKKADDIGYEVLRKEYGSFKDIVCELASLLFRLDTLWIRSKDIFDFNFRFVGFDLVSDKSCEY